MRTNTGLVSVTFRRLTPDDIIARTVDAGLSCIEWGSDIHVPAGDLENARRVGEATRTAGLSVSSYGTYYRLGQGQCFREYLDAAEALGAPRLRLWAGTRGSADTDPDTRRQWVEEARRLAGEAADRGLTISFEYHPGTLTDRAASARRLMEEVNHPAAHLYWQPDFSQSEESLLSGLDAVLPFVDILHVFTWRPDNTRLPLSCGQDFWRRVLGRLPDRADKTLLLEFLPGDDPALLPGEAKTLQQIEKEVWNHE
jgi:sugar phosphate isomerase/epimerase